MTGTGWALAVTAGVLGLVAGAVFVVAYLVKRGRP